MVDVFGLISWQVVIFVIATGEFFKKLFKDIFNKDKFTHFWQVVIFVTPLTVLYVYYTGIDYSKAVVGYFVAFWLYQAFVKDFLIMVGLKK